MTARNDATLNAQHLDLNAGDTKLDVTEQYTVIQATFSPPEWTHHLTLKPEAKQWIGRRGRFEALWLLGTPDAASSPYSNDWAMRPVDTVDGAEWPFAWCRLSDLIDRDG
jgi:hypothetical protein